MAFEKVTLTVAKESGINFAYFAYGTMWAPKDGTTVDNLVKFQTTYPDTVISLAGDEFAVDFVGQNQGKPLDRWSLTTV